MKILVTGTSGQVGGELMRTLAGLGELIAPRRAEMDLEHAPSIRGFVRELKPDWIVNPAAYTAVDRAESETHLAHCINAEAPRVLGEEAARLGIPVVHFSTDYVFPGTGTTPWRETDHPQPLGTYGATKLEGERALAGSGAAHVVLRTSWVYGATGKNFLRTILKAAAERPELRIVGDQHGAPTTSGDLARLTAEILRQCQNGIPEEKQGVYHAVNSGETTWFGFAEAMVAAAKEREPQKTWAKLTSIHTAEYPTPAKRPENSRLNCERLAQNFGYTMPSWQDGLRAVMEEMTELPG